MYVHFPFIIDNFMTTNRWEDTDTNYDTENKNNQDLSNFFDIFSPNIILIITILNK
jgi:hypothetical protein